MTDRTTPSRYSPLIMLGLVAVIVLLSWLLVVAHIDKPQGDMAASSEVGANSQPAQQIYRWKLVTSWPKNFPGLGLGPERFAERLREMSGGRLDIKVYGGGEIVPPLGVFDAVSLGTVEMGHSGAYYWKGKIPSSPFFGTLPFGLTAQQQNAWLYYGGGMELWREAYAPYNIIPLAAGNTGMQMGGWFNKEINSIEDIRGLKMRIPGIGGEVFSRAGGTAVNVPGGEIYTSLQTGVIDATEWVGPYNDIAIGLHEVAKYYYYPGWHEPGPSLELLINRQAFESLPKDLQTMIEVTARYVNQDMLNEYTARNSASLTQILANPEIELRRFPNDVLRSLKQASDEYMAEVSASDPMANKAYKSWREFSERSRGYYRISEKAYGEMLDAIEQ